MNKMNKMNKKYLLFEQASPPGPDWDAIASRKKDDLQTKGCTVAQDGGGLWYCKKGSCVECGGTPQPTPTPSAGSTPPPTPTPSAGSTPPPTPTPSAGSGGIPIPDIPELPDLQGIIADAWGKIKSWFGKKVDDGGDWMKDTFTKSDYDRAMEECYKVPYENEEAAKKALEEGDIVDYYKLKDKNGKIVFLGKAWDCDNKGGIPPCFKNLSGGKYNPEDQSYREEYFEELDDAGVYDYYCNGTVSFKPYYESDETGEYIESSRPKVWYKWNPKTGVIDKP